MFQTIPVARSIPISSKGDWMAFKAASLALDLPIQYFPKYSTYVNQEQRLAIPKGDSYEQNFIKLYYFGQTFKLKILQTKNYQYPIQGISLINGKTNTLFLFMYLLLFQFPLKKSRHFA